MTPPVTTTLDEPEGTITRKVRISETLFQQLGAESVEWGEPDEDGFYTPASRLAAQPAPPAEALRLLAEIINRIDYINPRADPDNAATRPDPSTAPLPDSEGAPMTPQPPEEPIREGICLSCAHWLPFAGWSGLHPSIGLCSACRDLGAMNRGPCSPERGCRCGWLTFDEEKREAVYQRPPR